MEFLALLEHELNELILRGDRSNKNKILRKKINKAKRLKKCSGNMTPSVKVSNGVPRVTCSPKDRKKSRQMKKIYRKLKANPMKMRRRVAKARDTKIFRQINTH